MYSGFDLHDDETLLQKRMQKLPLLYWKGYWWTNIFADRPSQFPHVEIPLKVAPKTSIPCP